MTDSCISISASGAAPVPGVVTQGGTSQRSGAIFHPIIDLLCLGGASLCVLPLLIILPDATLPLLVIVSLTLADIINHPHFAVSYQIFYRGFREKLRGDVISRSMRARYIFAGLVVPALLFAFFAYSFLTGNARMIGWGGNLMLLLVGWHYTKQGYGMLIVDSVYKRRFFSDAEKTVLRCNAYGCWLSFWLFTNWHVSEHELWGLAYYSFEVPAVALLAVGGATLVTSLLTFAIFARALRSGGGGLPVAGTMAYVTTLYVWLGARFAPAALLFVPMFHSLQYLLIVARYEVNRTRALTHDSGRDDRSGMKSLAGFAALAALLGATGFWWAPRLFDALVPYDHAALGGAAFLFMFWIFINVHHYFIDNVIWRRDNPETGAYLFGSTRRLTTDDS